MRLARFGNDSGGLGAVDFRVLKLVAISPEKGGESIVDLTSSPEVAGITGKYFYKCKVSRPTKEAQDDVSAKRLWTRPNASPPE